MKRVFVLVQVLVIMLFGYGITVKANDNLIRNGGFEELESQTDLWSTEKPVYWDDLWMPIGKAEVAISQTESFEGKNALYINAEEEARVAITQDVDVESNSSYDLSTHIKTQNIKSEQGARLRVLYFSGDEQEYITYSDQLKGTNDWTNISERIEIKDGITSIKVQLFFETGVGEAWYDQVLLKKIETIDDIKLLESTKTINVGESYQANIETTPVDFNHDKLIWETNDERVVKVKDGIIEGVNPGKAKVTVYSPDESISRTIDITVKNNENGSSALPNYNEKITLQEKEMRFLFDELLPNDYEVKSGDEEIALVKKGLVIGKKAGETKIKIVNSSGEEEGVIQVTVESSPEDVYQKMLNSWLDVLVGFDYYLVEDEIMHDIQQKKDESVVRLWETMYKGDNREFLWKELSSTTDSSAITAGYRNLYKMAEAIVSPGSDFYLNEELLRDTLSAIEWMYVNRYNNEVDLYGNWWDFEIGTPRAINDILVVLYPILSEEEILKYTEPINKFVPDVNYMKATIEGQKEEATGANQIDVSKVKLIQNILTENPEEIRKAKNALSKTLNYIDKGDGFYQDGSFVQHTNIPSTGSYGNVLIEGLSQLLTVVQNTEFSIDDPKLNNVYEWIENSFSPLIYKGSLMDMVRGRGISREALQDHAASVEVIRSVARFTEFAPNDIAVKLKGKVKTWLQDDTYFDYLSHAGSYRDINLAKQILKDENIARESAQLLFKNFANMDRIVYRNPDADFAFGFSMHSERIQNYEDMNNENRKGWYTGDGMLFLYNDDLSHYSDGYWATVDPYRLPGTTEEVAERTDGSGQTTSTKTFVGGSSVREQYGTVAMDFENWNQNISVKKSWFAFGDKLIALGSGMDSIGDKAIETTIENRKLKGNQEYSFIVDGKKNINGEETLMEDVSWALLQSSTDKESIGYLFPKKEDVYIKQEMRSGAWSDINYTQSPEEITNEFLTMWLDHGKNIQDKDYAYIVYPNTNSSQMTKHEQEKQVEIIENSKTVQAIKDTELDLIGVNLWENKRFTIDDFTIHHASSVTIEDKQKTITFGIADPTMKSEKVKLTIKVEEGQEYEILSKPANVEYEKQNEEIEVIVNTEESLGETTEFVLQRVSVEESDVTDSDEIEDEHEKETADSEDSGKGKTESTDIEEDVSGKELPKTATNYYNLLLLGGLLIIMTLFYFVQNKTRKSI